MVPHFWHKWSSHWHLGRQARGLGLHQEASRRYRGHKSRNQWCQYVEQRDHRWLCCSVYNSDRRNSCCMAQSADYPHRKFQTPHSPIKLQLMKQSPSGKDLELSVTPTNNQMHSFRKYTPSINTSTHPSIYKTTSCTTIYATSPTAPTDRRSPSSPTSTLLAWCSITISLPSTTLQMLDMSNSQATWFSILS